jgi:hypothetical protein
MPLILEVSPGGTDLEKGKRIVRQIAAVAVHGGVVPDAICWGSHLDLMLLPDCLVCHGGEVLDRGFASNEWKSRVRAGVSRCL